jgi:hypothetical protein
MVLLGAHQEGLSMMYGARLRQKCTLGMPFGSHACSLEASMRVTNGIPLERPLPLIVTNMHSVQTLKAGPVLNAQKESFLRELMSSRKLLKTDRADISLKVEKLFETAQIIKQG